MCGWMGDTLSATDKGQRSYSEQRLVRLGAFGLMGGSSGGEEAGNNRYSREKRKRGRVKGGEEEKAGGTRAKKCEVRGARCEVPGYSLHSGQIGKSRGRLREKVGTWEAHVMEHAVYEHRIQSSTVLQCQFQRQAREGSRSS